MSCSKHKGTKHRGSAGSASHRSTPSCIASPASSSAREPEPATPREDRSEHPALPQRDIASRAFLVRLSDTDAFLHPGRAERCCMPHFAAAHSLTVPLPRSLLLCRSEQHAPPTAPVSQYTAEATTLADCSVAQRDTASWAFLVRLSVSERF